MSSCVLWVCVTLVMMDGTMYAKVIIVQESTVVGLAGYKEPRFFSDPIIGRTYIPTKLFIDITPQ